MGQAHALIQAEQDVEVLHRLAGRARDRRRREFQLVGGLTAGALAVGSALIPQPSRMHRTTGLRVMIGPFLVAPLLPPTKDQSNARLPLQPVFAKYRGENPAQSR